MFDYSILVFLVAASFSLIGGIFFGIYSNKIFSLSFMVKNQREKKQVQDLIRSEENTGQNESLMENNRLSITANTTSPDPVLQKKNMQLLEDNIKLYQFEKNLASSAIESILTASKNKTIDSFEKDRLLLKYRDQLKGLNNKMEEIQSEIDVTKLIDLRNDLASLLDNKISDIDEKIKEINTKIKSHNRLLKLKNINKNNSNNNINRNYNYNDSLNNNLDSSASDNSVEEAIEIDLKPKHITSYKTNKNYKLKEKQVNQEREKITDLKIGVLEALKKLDKAKNVKEEIKKEVLDIHDNNKNEQDGLIDFLKGNSADLTKQSTKRNEDDEDYKNTPESTITQNNKNNIPKIYNSLIKREFQNNIIAPSTSVVTPILKNTNNNEIKINTNEENLNPDKELDRVVKENTKNTFLQNKNTPLYNIINYSDLNTDPNNKPKEFNLNNKDKKKIEDTGTLTKNNSEKKTKFSFRSIFSRDNKEKKEERERSDPNLDTDIDTQ